MSGLLLEHCPRKKEREREENLWVSMAIIKPHDPTNSPSLQQLIDSPFAYCEV
jgi:hypothetical protein